jgi:hypothetical protein
MLPDQKAKPLYRSFQGSQEEDNNGSFPFFPPRNCCAVFDLIALRSLAPAHTIHILNKTK